MATSRTRKTTTPAKPSRSAKTTSRTSVTSAEKKTPRKAAKKVTPKKTVKTKSSVVERPLEASREEQKDTSSARSLPFRSIRVRRSYILTILIIIVFAILVYLTKGYFFVASVNGQLISRSSIDSDLEKQYGAQELDYQITKALVEQEAAKEHVTVSQQEINQEIKNNEDSLKKQGQNLDQVLQTEGLTRQSFADRIKLQKLVDKMLGKNVTVSDSEAKNYLDQNKSSLPPGTTLADAKDQLKQQKVNDKLQPWLADLQKKANIQKFITF